MQGVYVNIGCGFSPGKSWRNYDASPTLRFERLPVIGRFYTKNGQRFPESVRFGDIVRRPLCADGEAEAVFCSHMLEHLPLSDMRRALGHINRMLRPGGTFRLIVPDLATLVANYAAAEDAERGHVLVRRMGMGMEGSAGGLASRLLSGFRLSRHQWMYDEASMRHELDRAGFRDIRRSDFGDATLPAFGEVESRGRYHEGDGPALGMECRK